MAARRTMWDRVDEIDASREDPGEPESSSIQVTLTKPVTANNFAYPETAAVRVERGRWPTWFRPFVSSIRRIQTRKDPNYGFVTDMYSWATPDTYVPAHDPGDGPHLYRRLMAAAQAAGWIVKEWTPGRQFDAWAPPEKGA